MENRTMTARHRTIRKTVKRQTFLNRILHPKHPVEAFFHCITALGVATYIMGSPHDGIVASALVAIDRIFRLIGNES
jgi:hypothetical protein